MDRELSTTASHTGVQRGQVSNALFLFGLSLVLVLAASLLFFPDNRFSFRCHADEPGKVAQIQSGERNFHHPMLMLNTAQVVFALSGMEPAPQKIVVMGRTITGVFSILSILLLCYAAFVSAGRLAAGMCGLFLLLSPLSMEVSHYFKEDPSMMVGISASFLAMALYQRTPSLRNLLFLSLGVALAASGKHLGIAILPFCIYAIFKQGGGARHLCVFLGVSALAYALINFQAVAHFAGFMGGIDREVVRIKRGGEVPLESIDPFGPVRKYYALLLGNVALPLFWFVGYALWTWARRRPEKTPLGHAALLALLVFVAVSLVPKTAARYFLPVIYAVCFIAAVGAARVFENRDRRWRIVGFALPLIWAIGMTAPRLYATYRGFNEDSRLQMARWISLNLPPQAVIAQDRKGLLYNLADPLSDSPYKVPQKLYDAGFDIETASLAALRANGVQYLVVPLQKGKGPKKSSGIATPRPDDPLSSALPNCKKLWSWSEKKVGVENVCPWLVVYELPPVQTP